MPFPTARRRRSTTDRPITVVAVRGDAGRRELARGGDVVARAARGPVAGAPARRRLPRPTCSRRSRPVVVVRARPSRSRYLDADVGAARLAARSSRSSGSSAASSRRRRGEFERAPLRRRSVRASNQRRRQSLSAASSAATTGSGIGSVVPAVGVVVGGRPERGLLGLAGEADAVGAELGVAQVEADPAGEPARLRPRVGDARGPPTAPETVATTRP